MNHNKKGDYLKEFDSIFGTNTLENIKFDNMHIFKLLFQNFMEDLYKPSEYCKKLGKQKMKIISELKDSFSKNQQILFEKYCELNNLMLAEIEEQLFLFGCIMSRQLDMEIQVEKNKKSVDK